MRRPTRRLGLALVPVLAAILSQTAAPLAAAPTHNAAERARAAQQAAAQIGQETQQTQQDLSAIDARIAQLNGEIKAEEADSLRLGAVLVADARRESQIQVELTAVARVSYEEQGSWLPMILQSGNLAQLWDNVSQARIVAANQDQLRAQIEALREQVEAAKRRLDAELASLQSQQQQVAKLAALTENRLSALQIDGQLVTLGGGNEIYAPVPGGTFSPDTDLRIVPPVDPAALARFLNGTAFQGLAPVFISSGQRYHVNPLYLVAHAIEESTFGTSSIARAKHNLYGIGADDNNPGADAYTFPSFAACIQYQAQAVSTNYLNSSGRFYHGPTLRGMNVDYATDPFWAEKIAAIYLTLPDGHHQIPLS